MDFIRDNHEGDSNCSCPECDPLGGLLNPPTPVTKEEHFENTWYILCEDLQRHPTWKEFADMMIEKREGMPQPDTEGLEEWFQQRGVT